MRVLGPYKFNSGKCVGRRYVVIFNDDGSRRNVLYSRYLMEQKLGRRLPSNEHVDHIDEDKTNDSLRNLQILSASENAKKSAASRPKAEMFTFTCPTCGKQSEKPARFVRHNKAQGKAGPFCGKECAGKYKPR